MILILTFNFIKMLKYNTKEVITMVKLPKISWEKTKNNVEEVITKYNYYNLSICDQSNDQMPSDFKLKLIDNYDFNNKYLKISANEQEERTNFINYVRFSYNKLTIAERKIIYFTYMDKENDYDDRFIANDLGFSLGYYYVKKKQTLIRFAYSLGIEAKDDKKS